MKISTFIFLFCSVIAVHFSWGQYDANTPIAIGAKPYAATIQQDDLKNHLTILASDEFEGRETGTEGQRKAAAYIANFFASLGLPEIGDDGYFQKIDFSSEKWNSLKLNVANRKFRNMYDFYGLPTMNAGSGVIATDRVYFLGYGIDDQRYSDYKHRRVKGKTILIYAGEPVLPDGTYLLSGTQVPSEWSTDLKAKLKAAQDHGVAAVLIIDPAIQKSISDNRNLILGNGMKVGGAESALHTAVPNIFISTTVARQIIGDRMNKVVKARERIQNKGKSKKVKLKNSLRLEYDKKDKFLYGENVLGYIEGSDPLLKEELVIITAHYDHLGKRGTSIFNGADDNGSGTSAVLEIAEAFAKAKKEGAGPRRSVLCILVSGEEKGLLGSRYYVEHPVFPLDKTIVNINVDMIGRVDEKHRDNPEYIYIIGADRLSSELHEINEKVNENYTRLVLDYTYNDPKDPNRYYYRSDHYNFAKNGIPAIFYFNGTHADYHRPTDTIEKIQFDKMTKITHLVFYTAWELANRDERIKVDKH